MEITVPKKISEESQLSEKGPSDLATNSGNAYLAT